MLPFANFLDHHCSCKQLKQKMFPVSIGITAKVSLPSERQFTVFYCSCSRSTRLFAAIENFRKAPSINATIGFSESMPCLRLIIAAGFGHVNRTCHFSPIKMLRSWANALYSENSAFRAGSRFSYRAAQQLASLSDSSLATLLIDFALAASHENLLAVYQNVVRKAIYATTPFR